MATTLYSVIETVLKRVVQDSIDTAVRAGLDEDRAEIVVAQLLTSTSLGLVLSERARLWEMIDANKVAK